MVVIWIASVHVSCDNKNRSWRVGDIIIKMHLCTPCLNEANASVDVFSFMCVCLHLSRLNYKNQRDTSSSTEKMKLCSKCQTHFLILFFSRTVLLGVIHVMTSSSIRFHTCIFTHSPPSSDIFKKKKKKKSVYPEHNVVQTRFLSSSTAPPDSVSNFTEHGFSLWLVFQK